MASHSPKKRYPLPVFEYIMFFCFICVFFWSFLFSSPLVHGFGLSLLRLLFLFSHSMHTLVLSSLASFVLTRTPFSPHFFVGIILPSNWLWFSLGGGGGWRLVVARDKSTGPADNPKPIKQPNNRTTKNEMRLPIGGVEARSRRRNSKTTWRNQETLLNANATTQGSKPKTPPNYPPPR